MKVYQFVLFAGVIQTIAISANIGNGEIYFEHPKTSVVEKTFCRPEPAVVIDSSVNGYTLWTQIQECIGYNPIVDGIQIVNRAFTNGGHLNVHQAPGNLSYWVHDAPIYTGQLGPARYPSSMVDADLFGPHIAFICIVGGFQSGAQFERGGWFSSLWDPPVFLGPGISSCYRIIGKQLPTNNLLFIQLCDDENGILYRVLTPDLQTLISQGVLASGVRYWGYDTNDSIASVFYFDTIGLNVYYRTTRNGITWSVEQNYNMVWPQPYANNIIGWTQMALTESGNPLLVFDNWNGDDTTYPYYSKVYVSYKSGHPCVEVSSTFAAPDTECVYPTIATGGNKAAVLYCMPRNNEPDSLNWWDFYVNWSTDNGVTWGTPQNCTQTFTYRPGLPQLAKRIDILRERVYYVYAVDMIEDHDPLWHVWRDLTSPDPMYICFNYANYTGIAESGGLVLDSERLNMGVLPNIIKHIAQIQYTIPERQKVRLVLYDVAGREIKRIAEGTFEPGVYTYNFNSTGLSSGIYFLILEGEKETKTQKILILK